jgi:peptidase M28-like protein/PDZ domain-containing protein/PA domain-containing protein
MKFKLLRHTLAYLVVAAISLAVLAQQPTKQLTPSVERLRQHVTYLASDALEGRRTGSRGANDAAHYIAGECSRLGLRPGNALTRAARTRDETPSHYLQKFPYVAGVELGKNNLLSFSLRPEAEAKPVSERSAAVGNFRVGEDWIPLGFSSNARFENLPATFAGYGITAAELNYNDYAGADVSGRIAIALSGTPDGANPHGQFGRYEDVRWKAIAARNAGAKALIVIAHEGNFKDDRLARLWYDNTAGDAGLPVAVISRQAGKQLLKLESTDLLDKVEQTVSAWVVGGGPAANCKTPCGVTNNFKFPINFTFTFSTDIARHNVVAENVIGILDGSDPELKSETIVVGAHYDHLGRGGEGSLAPGQGEIHHGADDNASGVAALLELARIFSLQKPRPRRTIVFIAFSGEEEGLLGSNYYVNHPVMPLGNTIAMINMDMIGRMKENKLIIGGVGTAKEWKGLIEDAAPAALVTASSESVIAYGFPRMFALTLSEDGYGPSDHSSFYARQIPVLFLWTGTHEDYHKPSDTADKINYTDEVRIVSFVERIVRDIDKSLKRPTFTVAKSESSGRTTGFRVYLGTIPNYADSTDGLLLDGVRDDSPAAKAGLKAGDRVVKLADREVRNVYDYTYALGEMKAGEEYEIEILRGTERLKLRITPAGRK